MQGVEEYNPSFGGTIFQATLQECRYYQGKDCGLYCNGPQLIHHPVLKGLKNLPMELEHRYEQITSSLKNMCRQSRTEQGAIHEVRIPSLTMWDLEECG